MLTITVLEYSITLLALETASGVGLFGRWWQFFLLSEVRCLDAQVTS